MRKVDMEKVLVDDVPVRRSVVDAAQEDLRLARGRQRVAGVEIGGQQAVVEGAGLEADLLRLLVSGQQLRPLVRADARADERSAIEVVDGLVIGVRLDTKFRIIGETALRERKSVIGSQRVGARRHRDASHVRAEHALARHPPMGHLVPLDDGVALVEGLARSAEPLPEIVPVERPGEDRAGRLVEDGIGHVHPLHHLGIAHRQVRVRRSVGDRVAGKAGAHAEHVHARGGKDRRADGRLQRPVGNAGLAPLGSIGQLLQLRPQDWTPLMRADSRCGCHVTERRRNVELDRLIHVRVGEHLDLSLHCRLLCRRRKGQRQAEQGQDGRRNARNSHFLGFHGLPCLLLPVVPR